MGSLVNTEQARSDTVEAIRCTGQRNWQGITRLMVSFESACPRAHKAQTALIGQDKGCDKIEVNSILVRTQNHLISAILYQDLAREIISLREELRA